MMERRYIRLGYAFLALNTIRSVVNSTSRPVYDVEPDITNDAAHEAYSWDPTYDTARRDTTDDLFDSSMFCDSSGLCMGDNEPMFYDYQPPLDPEEVESQSTGEIGTSTYTQESAEMATPHGRPVSLTEPTTKTKKSHFLDSRTRRFNWINKRISRLLQDHDHLDHLLQIGDQEACALLEEYRADQLMRSRKHVLKKILLSGAEEEEISRRVAKIQMRDKLFEPFEEGECPASPSKRQRMRNLYHKLQRDIIRYNSTRKLKKPYDITTRQVKAKKGNIGKIGKMKIGEGDQFAAGNAEADSMVERLQNMRVMFAANPKSAEVMPFLLELDEWTRKRRYKFAPIEKPVYP